MPRLDFHSEFPPVSTEAWEEAIRKDLKGADRGKLIWSPEEGLEIQPYYRSADIAGIADLDSAPGEFPYLRGAREQGGWHIREEIDAMDAEEANRAACAAVAGGADEIAFTRVSPESVAEFAILLASLNEIPVHFAAADERAVRLLIDRLKSRPHSARISAALDPLADPGFSAEVLAAGLKNFVPFAIDGGRFHESAATCAEETGFALAAAIDFVAEMRERGVDADRIADSLAFAFAIGPEYFLEIAKLRAFRVIWAQAAEKLGVSRERAKAHVDARTARWNTAVYDGHNNILRATTEAMSAIIGGADTVSTAPFDECYERAGEASRRLARNTQLILRLEAQLARVADPGAGSYYLESLTDQIARQAWGQMQQIEAAGGFRKASGLISGILDQRAAARKKSVRLRRRVLTGVNRFANVAETMGDGMDAARQEAGDRAARCFETLRLRSEAHRAKHPGKIARILLAEIGDGRMRGARSQFSADFLACAGLAAQARTFKTAGEIATAAADLIVLCSSDDEYLAIVTELFAALRACEKWPPVIVAGNPASATGLKELGVAEFIHLRSDAVEVLEKIQRLLGMEE
jgi:methylmalonyl-CoA mutase